MSSIANKAGVPAGVITGNDVKKLFEYARQQGFAIPAVNVTSSSNANAVLEAARDAGSPIIIQVSQGGAAFFAGKGIDNKDQKASIIGSTAAAHHVRTVAPAYGIPVVLHTDHCAKKLLPWFDGMLDADEAYFKEHNEPLFRSVLLRCFPHECLIDHHSSHMLDLSEESKEENISLCVKYFTRMAKMNQWLEMEIGITGGEEDGVSVHTLLSY